MPSYFPTRMLDAAEQRDFLSGVQPYMLDLQQQVQSGISNLTATARGMATQGFGSRVTGVGDPPLHQNPSPITQDPSRGYLSAAVPAEPAAAPPPVVSGPSPRAPVPAPTPIEHFKLPSFEDLTGATAAAPSPAPAPSGGTVPKNATDRSPFSLPTWQDLTGFAEPARAAVQQAAQTVGAALTPGAAPAAALGLAGPSPTRTGPPAQPGDIEAYIRQAAAARGIDPNVAVKVVGAEGGLTDPVRQSDVVYQGQREQSYGPLQLNVTGGVGSAALKAGIDPRDPSQWRQAVDFGLDEVARSGWGQWHGAARVGVGPREGIGGPRSAAPAAAPAPAPLAPSAATPAGAPPLGTYTKDQLVPNQITEGAAQGLSTAEALAVCGPAAAVAFARANGRNPTLREAKELASSLGLWDVGTGMHGPATQVQLLDKLGVPATLQQGADWGRIAAEVQRGKPVILDSPSHYYVASDYDPATGEFEFGQSAGVLRASQGRTRFRPEELPSLGMGAPRATIFMAGGQP